MECFGLLWAHHNLEEVGASPPWCINGKRVSDPRVSPPKFFDNKPTPRGITNFIYKNHFDKKSYIASDLLFSVEHISRLSIEMEKSVQSKRSEEKNDIDEFEVIKEIIKRKAQKHSSFYKNLRSGGNDQNVPSYSQLTIERYINYSHSEDDKSENTPEESVLHRRSNYLKINDEVGESIFKSVKQMRQRYMAMLETTYRNLQAPLVVKRNVIEGEKQVDKPFDEKYHENFTSILKDSSSTTIPSPDLYQIEYRDAQETVPSHTHSINTLIDTLECDLSISDISKTENFDTLLSGSGNNQDSYLAPPTSGYCSSAASGTSDDEKDKAWLPPKAILQRTNSNDSALHLNPSDEESWRFREQLTESTETLNQDLDRSNEGNVSETNPTEVTCPNVPSKTLIEGGVVVYPLNRQGSIGVSDSVECDEKSAEDIRRHSSVTDDGDESFRCRFFRTPSVVVSDYSDDVTGLTLEDVEFFKNQRRDQSSSAESSLNSSCSNLNYCGSSISALDSDFVWMSPFRKNSASSCSEDEDGRSLERVRPSGWRKLRNIVQWTPFFQTYKKQRYPWVQLAGHQGNFKAGPDQGTVLKKLSIKEEKCFKVLMNDVLKPYVPEYKGQVSSDDGECSYIQLQDLLGDFVNPCVMDCKVGVRTYLEEELAKAKEKPKLRKDMYEKMIQIDPNAPTDEEHRLKAVTKPRYMIWRETISSTATLGFRIEGIRKSDGTSTKDFKTTKSKDQIVKAFHEFTDGFPHAVPKYIQRLKAIKATLEASNFFNTHEVIGSSLLFVHDRYNANVWLIDFAKTLILPSTVSIDHNSFWKIGNHEDGYMIGINNIISIFMMMLEQQPVCVTPPPPACVQENIERQASFQEDNNEE